MESAGKSDFEHVPAADIARDADLAVRIRAGDEQAFEALFHAHAAALCRLAYSYLGSTALAEEVVQDVLLRVWERRAVLPVRQSLGAYLYVAVRNRALDAMKSARSAARVQAAGWVADDQWAVGMAEPARSPFTSLEDDELTAAVRKAISRLPDRCRLVFTLRWESHLTNAAIAEQLDISIKAVERHRQRALKQLAAALRRFFP